MINMLFPIKINNVIVKIKANFLSTPLQDTANFDKTSIVTSKVEKITANSGISNNDQIQQSPTQRKQHLFLFKFAESYLQKVQEMDKHVPMWTKQLPTLIKRKQIKREQPS